MKKLRKISVILLLISVLLTGSARSKNNVIPSRLNMVTGVRVICQRENTTIERQYIQPHKIGVILTYLRLLKCGSQTQNDPEQLTGDSFEITLYDAAGKCNVYRQRANKYFSKSSGPWTQILPEQASLLYPLILSMPTD